MSNPVTIATGSHADIPIQCYVRGSGVVPAIYGATDILTAAVYQARQSVAIFAPSVAWYTADNSQAGYTQGQVEATFTAANCTLLVPSVSYTLLIWRALSSSPSETELIARVPLVVEPLAIP